MRCVVGDVHGDLSKARWALNLAGVLSSDGRDLWTGGETVCLVLDSFMTHSCWRLVFEYDDAKEL